MSPNLPSDTPKPPSSTSPDPARIPSNLPDLQELPNLPELQELREPSKPSGRAASGGGWRRSLVRLIGALALPVALLGLAGCDYFAEKKLVPGVHTEADGWRGALVDYGHTAVWALLAVALGIAALTGGWHRICGILASFALALYVLFLMAVLLGS